MRRDRSPLWFTLLVAVALALALNAINGPRPADAPLCAFWFLLVSIASAIWRGLEAAGRIALQALAWSVKALWAFATATYNGLKAAAAAIRVGLKTSWEFLRTTYDDVLKPAWQHLYRWFQKFRDWLDRTFAPVLKWLHDLRDHLLDFYARWIRPWLDLINVTRHALRVLSTFGLAWARALDRRLGDLEARLERPFSVLLAKVNEVINLVNRVVGFDGLLQRAALIRSIVRDYDLTWRAIVNPRSTTLNGHTAQTAGPLSDAKATTAIASEFRAFVATGGGANAAQYRELSAAWRAALAKQ